MKFERDYHKRQIAEWADAYMNYAALKSFCKETPSSENLQELITQCQSAIDSVNHFYCNIYTTLLSKLSSESQLADPSYDVHSVLTAQLDHDELDYIELQHQKTLFTEIAADFEKLRWYGRVNTDGFRKIIRRVGQLDLDGPRMAFQIERTLSKLEFSTQAQCSEALGNLNKTIRSIARAQQDCPDTLFLSQDGFCTRLARLNPSIPAVLLFRVIESDDYRALEELIDDVCKSDLGFSRTVFLRVLFQCSIRCSSHSWVNAFISCAISQDAVVAIQGCLRSIIVEHCHATIKERQLTSSRYRRSVSLLTYICDQLLAQKLDLLYKPDGLGRTPLHYACECGLAEVCEIILGSMKAWEQNKSRDIRSALLLGDMQSRSPMHITILKGHLEVIDVLTRFYCRNSLHNSAEDSPSLSTASNELLLFATRSNSADIVRCVLTIDADINCSEAMGQTPLHLAARSGNETLTSLLLRYRPHINRTETTKGWTPLIIASVGGFSIIADLLLQHGANVEHRDLSGWTAIDHASYRGHIPLAKKLSGWTAIDHASHRGHIPLARNLSKAVRNLVRQQRIDLRYEPKISLKRNFPTRGQPIRTCSTTESYIMVNLGSLDSSDAAPAVDLNTSLTEDSSTMYPE
ncbi:MAG: hypothetical protein Q9160_006320 [Pyrenula sp. 1 TL-2023]